MLSLLTNHWRKWAWWRLLESDDTILVPQITVKLLRIPLPRLSNLSTFIFLARHPYWQHFGHWIQAFECNFRTNYWWDIFYRKLAFKLQGGHDTFFRFHSKPIETGDSNLYRRKCTLCCIDYALKFLKQRNG